ncbi:MAG: hypothetical protein Q9M36_02870 [Sulfurovum sp.]|nr:hypothetical protein [Sulfurovum sp.]
MNLPEIVLPVIDLPFHIPLLTHPLILHFLVVLPMVVLLLELLNMMMKKKTLGGMAFFMLILSVMASMGAYFSLLIDGQDNVALLSQFAQNLLVEHQLWGVYLMLGSIALLILRFFTLMGNGFLKIVYMIGLIAFVVGVGQYAMESKVLVYGHGMNVKQMQLNDARVAKLDSLIEESKAQRNAFSLEIKSLKEALQNAKKAKDIALEKAKVLSKV